MRGRTNAAINRIYGFFPLPVFAKHALDRLQRTAAGAATEDFRHRLASKTLRTLEGGDGPISFADRCFHIFWMRRIKYHHIIPVFKDRFSVTIPEIDTEQGRGAVISALADFAHRLREARGALGLNQQDFAALGGVKKNSQVQYETAKTAPTVQYLYSLANAGIDIDYILTGSGAGIPLPIVPPGKISGAYTPEEAARSLAAALGKVSTTGANDNLVAIDEIDLAYGMGASFADGPVRVRQHEVSKALLRSMTASAPANLTLARGVGDSMEPTIADGDIVLIDRSQQFQQDAIMALSIGELAMIKRVRRDGDRVQLLSDNQRIPPYEVAADEVNLVGRVVFVGRTI